jgi:transketolase
VSGAYRVAILNRTRPSVIALSRQACPNHEGSAIEHVALGAYTLHEAPPAGDKPLQLCLVASGSEVRCVHMSGCVPTFTCSTIHSTHTRAHAAHAAEF